MILRRHFLLDQLVIADPLANPRDLLKEVLTHLVAALELILHLTKSEAK